MRSGTKISTLAAPPLGELRRAGAGMTIWIEPDAPARADWPRYVEALGSALARGADVRWRRDACEK